MRALYDSKSKTMKDYGIRQHFTKAAQYQTWLDVEAALALSQAELGIIPMDAAKKIAEAAKVEFLDLEEIDRIYQEIGHGFVPFLRVFVKVCKENSGKYVHFGTTTQNIQQTSQLLQAKKIHYKYMEISQSILRNLAKLATQHCDTTMAGRTHGRHAIPITYGYKASVWISEFKQAVERLAECEKRVFQCMMGGAVGAYNSMPEKGEEVQHLVAQKLGMYPMPVPSRNISTHKIEYIMNLALLANVCHKMAEEVFSTSIEEFSEVSEGFKKGTVGSSTMPHKINPKLSKGIIANSQKLYSLTNVGLYSSARPFEGDSSSYMLFDAILEEALESMTEIILRTEELTGNIQVHKEIMMKNASINGGIDNSEYIMMKIAEKLGKDEAHSILYKLAMEKLETGKPYTEVLENNETIKANFTAEEIKQALAPENYTGLSSKLAVTMAEEALEFAEALDKYKQ